MGSKSRETLYGASIRAAAERAAEARKAADRLAVEAWNKRMLGFQGPAQPSPTLGDALNAGHRSRSPLPWLHQTVALEQCSLVNERKQYEQISHLGHHKRWRLGVDDRTLQPQHGPDHGPVVLYDIL
jgi:hypothetical protein